MITHAIKVSFNHFTAAPLDATVRPLFTRTSPLIVANGMALARIFPADDVGLSVNAVYIQNHSTAEVADALARLNIDYKAIDAAPVPPGMFQ